MQNKIFKKIQKLCGICGRQMTKHKYVEKTAFEKTE